MQNFFMQIVIRLSVAMQNAMMLSVEIVIVILSILLNSFTLTVVMLDAVC
jgi:hypothetical protein